jgi:hypothetical protein
MKMQRAFSILVLLLLSFLPAFALGETLSVRPWCEIEPWVRVGADEYPLSEETAAKRVLEEGRTLFSAMVYGYTFVYTPSDAARKVAEVFELTPVAGIPWGAREVRVIETQTAGAKFFARLSLALPEADAKRRAAWSSAASDVSTGSGEASLFGGHAAKLEALKNAIKNAIRNHLSSRVLNKPREIRGEVVLWEDPQTGIRSGHYMTTAKVRLRITEIVPYRIF